MFDVEIERKPTSFSDDLSLNTLSLISILAVLIFLGAQRSGTMKNKDEQTGLVGLAIGAAVIGLVSAQKPINRTSIIDELVRLGRQKGDGVQDEVFERAAELVRKGV